MGLDPRRRHGPALATSSNCANGGRTECAPETRDDGRDGATERARQVRVADRETHSPSQFFSHLFAQSLSHSPASPRARRRSCAPPERAAASLRARERTTHHDDPLTLHSASHDDAARDTSSLSERRGSALRTRRAIRFRWWMQPPPSRDVRNRVHVARRRASRQVYVVDRDGSEATG